MDWLIKLVTEKIKCRFTGKIQINLYQGGISNVNIEESLKPPGL